MTRSALVDQEEFVLYGSVERKPAPPRVAFRRRVPRALAWLCCLYSTLGFAGAAAAQDRLKVAVVDVAKIFAGYYKTKEVEKTLADSHVAAEQQLEARMEVHHRLIEEGARIDKQLDRLAPDASGRADLQKQRHDKTREMEAQEKESQELKINLDRDLQELSVRLRNRIVEDILTVLRTRVESDHYDLILNKSAQISREKKVVLYANENLEITSDVLTTLNGNHPTSTPAPLAPLP